MNKADLIEALAPRIGGRTQAATAVESMVDLILREVAAGGTVGITGFGVFESIERAPRTGRNPRTGEAVPIAGTRSARFRPATYFKQVVADPSTLPTDGLAGVRVATHEETERAGAPATVRRTEPEAGTPAGREASPTDGSVPEAEAPTRSRRGRTGTSGAPDTVRKAVPRPADVPVEDPAPTTRSSGGAKVVIGGEDITQSMISAKKAKLAKAKDDRSAKGRKGKNAGKDGAGKGKAGSKKGSSKKDRARKDPSRKSGKSAGRSGKKAGRKG